MSDQVLVMNQGRIEKLQMQMLYANPKRIYKVLIDAIPKGIDG
jgi:ABC-type dipeptide/oligopeptide/nickel transport system ATPase component